MDQATGTRPGYEAVLSCGDVVTEWDPPDESWGGDRRFHWTRCPDELCRGQRRRVREIRPVAAG